MDLSSGIRSLEIDFDKEVLKINGLEVTDRTVIVTLPGFEDYKYKKIFNMKNKENPGSSEAIEVCYHRVTNDSSIEKEEISK